MAPRPLVTKEILFFHSFPIQTGLKSLQLALSDMIAVTSYWFEWGFVTRFLNITCTENEVLKKIVNEASCNWDKYPTAFV